MYLPELPCYCGGTLRYSKPWCREKFEAQHDLQVYNKNSGLPAYFDPATMAAGFAACSLGVGVAM
jgi:hypothetical protein